MVEYTVVYSHSTKRDPNEELVPFIKKVNEMLAKGWVLQSGIAATYNPIWRTRAREIYQAMVREKDG